MEYGAVLPEGGTERALASHMMVSRAGRAIRRPARAGHRFYPIEPDALEHSAHGGNVRSPPVRRIVVQLAPGIKRDSRTYEPDHIDHRFDDELPPREWSDPFQREPWMTQVIQDAEEQHDVENSDVCRR